MHMLRLVYPLVTAALTVGAVSAPAVAVEPAQHNCNVPDDPCHSTPTMVRYNRASEHGFWQLNPKFVFPKHFVQLAVQAHHRLVEQGKLPRWQPKAHPDCGTWWSCTRETFECAGGIASNNYWGCNGANTDIAAHALTVRLNHAQVVQIKCASTTLVGYFAGGPVGMVAGAGLCEFNSWVDAAGGEGRL